MLVFSLSHPFGEGEGTGPPLPVEVFHVCCRVPPGDTVCSEFKGRPHTITT